MPNLPYISPEIIAQYQKHVSETSAPATAKRRSSSLNKFFGWAHKDGHIESNPLSQSPVPSGISGKPKVLGTRYKRLKPLAFLSGTLGMAILAFLLVQKLSISVPFRLAPAQESFSG